MKRLIRKIINWAYGENIVLSMHFLYERTHNLGVMIYDYMIRSSVVDTLTSTMKSVLLKLGWVDKGDVLVRYSRPRLGWKPADGTLIVGYHE